MLAGLLRYRSKKYIYGIFYFFVVPAHMANFYFVLIHSLSCFLCMFD
jgi:hypothetical protein